jgi:asparagine synthase (glutamine-hydrolysing)
MIWGIVYKDQKQEVSKDSLKKMSYFGDGLVGNMQVFHEKNIAVGSVALPHIKKDESRPATNSDNSIIVIFQGKIYNDSELLDKDTLEKYKGSQAELILDLYEKMGQKFVNKLNGKFVFGIIDKKKNKVFLGRDRFGIEPLYYMFDNKKLIFSSTLKSIVNNPEVKKEINFHALYQFLLFCYNPAMYTFYKNVNAFFRRVICGNL